MKLQTRLPRSLVLRYALQFRDIHSGGGAPCAYDRVLSTRIGAGAAEAILDGEYGIMIGIVNGKIKRVPLEECAGKLKMVSPKDQTVKAAKQIGISFGD